MKKGQAALEFLMTYGWAILAAIIAIGVLYLIIGNPANIVGNRFTISEPFIKVAAAAATSGIQIEVKNGAGEAVTISSLAVTLDSDADSCTTNTTDSSSIASDSNVVLGAACSGLASGDRVKGAVEIAYTTSGSSIEQKATGSLNMRVS